MKYLAKAIMCFVFILCLSTVVFAQEGSEKHQQLFDELKALDSKLFNAGFNTCDTATMRILLSDDMEFYHDQNGLLESKEQFLQGVPNMCKMSYKPVRVLVDSSLQVFPLYANGQLYGAIQTGIHEFYGEEENKPRYLTSTAQFSHVWILEDSQWRLKRILSYDHVVPKN
jgi:hypothetical protein